MKERQPLVGRTKFLILAFFLFLFPATLHGQTAEETLAPLNKLAPAQRQQLIMAEAKKEGEVMVYTVMTASDFDELQKSFNQKYPHIRLSKLRQGGGRLYDIALNEAGSGKHIADVFMAGESSTGPLVQAGIVGRYLSPERDAYPENHKDPKGYWTAYLAYRWVFTYNTRLVLPQRLPKNFQELLDPFWKGKLAIDTDPHSWMAALIKAWGKKKAAEFFHALARQDLQRRRGRSLRAQLLAAGEFSASVEQSDNVIVQLKRRAAPIDYIYLPDTPSSLTPIALAKHAPHSYAAALFIDFVLSEEGQRVIADLDYVPTRSGVKTKDPEHAARDSRAKIAILNTDWFADQRAEVARMADEIFGRGGRK
jgi:iron(III) transport system substrate-binding protein